MRADTSGSAFQSKTKRAQITAITDNNDNRKLFESKHE